MTREADWAGAIEHVLREHGRLDVLVNNAGRGGLPARVTAEHVALEDWDLIMAANATSVMLGTKHAIPAMRRTGGGAIVNVVSIYAMVGSRAGTSYHASKGAARALTRATAIQYAPEGIRINAVFPGFVETGMTAELHARPGVREERVVADAHRARRRAGGHRAGHSLPRLRRRALRDGHGAGDRRRHDGPMTGGGIGSARWHPTRS